MAALAQTLHFQLSLARMRFAAHARERLSWGKNGQAGEIPPRSGSDHSRLYHSAACSQLSGIPCTERKATSASDPRGVTLTVSGRLDEGRAARGAIRNERMLREGRPDLVIAFPSGRGTSHTCGQAERRLHQPGPASSSGPAYPRRRLQCGWDEGRGDNAIDGRAYVVHLQSLERAGRCAVPEDTGPLADARPHCG
jgi:hypothetical protein